MDPFLVLEVHSVKLMVTIFPLLSLESLFVLPMLPSQELNHLFKFQCQCIMVYLGLRQPSEYLIT